MMKNTIRKLPISSIAAVLAGVSMGLASVIVLAKIASVWFSAYEPVVTAMM